MTLWPGDQIAGEGGDEPVGSMGHNCSNDTNLPIAREAPSDAP